MPVTNHSAKSKGGYQWLKVIVEEIMEEIMAEGAVLPATRGREVTGPALQGINPEGIVATHLLGEVNHEPFRYEPTGSG
jgi:hypothetical protein